jgi:hypothetical protein
MSVLPSGMGMIGGQGGASGAARIDGRQRGWARIRECCPGQEDPKGGNGMSANDLARLQRRVDAAERIDAALLEESAEGLSAAFPDLPGPPDRACDPTDGALWLIDRCLPGWAITLHGTATEPDGHWRCHLRRSDTRDDDGVIGRGIAPGVGLALLRALVSAARQLA